jgi:leucyl/phenylalanyl-tRNA--protein transferase
MVYLSQELSFPAVSLTHSSGIIALGGDLSGALAISL